MLLSLPKELRELIYQYVLRSSTGLVIYKRNLHSIREHYGHNQNFTLYAASPPNSQHYDPIAREPICVALLKVCRQTYEEAKNLLWSINVLVFDATEMPNIKQQLRIQHVLLQFRLDEDDRRHQPTSLPRTIGILGRWAQQGELKSLTLRTREPLRHPYDADSHVERIVYGHNLRWRAATEPGGPLYNVFRMVIFTGYNIYAISNGCRPTIALDEVQKCLHEAIGGEIWTEGNLCWSAGKQVASAWSAFEWTSEGHPHGRVYARAIPAIQQEVAKLPNMNDVYAGSSGWQPR